MTAKITENMCFIPSFEYVDNGIEHGVLSPFETKELLLKKGRKIAEGFKPLPCDLRMLKDVPVQLRDGITIYTDIYLPITDEEVPVLIGWSLMEKVPVLHLAIKTSSICWGWEINGTRV